MWGAFGSGGTSMCVWGYTITYNGTNGASLARPVSAPATATDVQNYLTGLPANSPHSVEANTQPLGQGASPQGATNETTTAVSPSDLPTAVKPVAQVDVTDIVLNPDAPKPAGTETKQTQQQTSTTTTTTTNPDGSTTEDTETQASVSCSGAEHDARTFGSVLQAHLTTWQGSGVAGTLDLLKTLTWPATLPVITLTSATWGSHAIDFNQWASVFLALRTLIIAGAGFAAYRIVFFGR